MTDGIEHDSNQDAEATVGTPPEPVPEPSQRALDRDAKIEELAERRARAANPVPETREAMLARRYQIIDRPTPEERDAEAWNEFDNPDVWLRIGGRR